MKTMKKISIVTPCFNEEENVKKLYSSVKDVFSKLPQYMFEHIFIDNCSVDNTAAILTKMAMEDKRVKVILNARNFGHIRSPYHALLQADGDAVVMMAADFQDPPEMIPAFLEKWESGLKIVIAVKSKSRENKFVYFLRNTYYKLVRNISEIDHIDNFTGFGLYDYEIIKILRKFKDPYPYFRGLICEIGFQRAVIEFTQPRRERGITKNNFYTLFDMAMLGLTSNSKVPLRLATILGFLIASVSMLVAIAYFVLKLIFWNTFNLGLAPLVIGLFFFSSVQLIFIGILGEYIGNIYTHLVNRPLVIEKKRINFDEDEQDEQDEQDE
jgi:glycosyltransferase involved in cell wall biosynthesis